MKTKAERCRVHKIVAIILSAIATLLIIAGFFVPPMGKIDGSVLQGAGEIIGMISIFFAWDNISAAIERGVGMKWQHGNTSVSTTGGKEGEQDNGTE